MPKFKGSWTEKPKPLLSDAEVEAEFDREAEAFIITSIRVISINVILCIVILFLYTDL
jgi:hypothetical protein